MSTIVFLFLFFSKTDLVEVVVVLQLTGKSYWNSATVYGFDIRYYHLMCTLGFFCVFFSASALGEFKNTNGFGHARPSHHARLNRKLIRKEVGHNEPTLIGLEIIGILLLCFGL